MYKLLIVSIFCLPFYVFAQGSGNCLLGNGTGSYAEIPHNTAFSSHALGSGELTVEAWVRVLAVNTDGNGQDRQPIVAKGFGGSWEWSLYVYDNLSVGFSTWQCGASSHSEPNAGAIALGQWVHVAGVFRAGVSNTVYINGIEVIRATGFSGSACTGLRPVRIGSREDGQFLNADIDEVRIWNRALSENELRSNMCQLRTGSETGLTAYYRFDEAANGTCAGGLDICDLGPNGFHGRLLSGMQRRVSGAALGNSSIMSYPSGGWTTAQSMSIGSTAEVFELSNVSGNPRAMHLYEVEQAPNVSCGSVGIGNNNRYFGVYPVGGTAVEYDVLYQYGANPFLTSTNEPFLELAQRSDNSQISCPAWAEQGATLDMPNQELRLAAVAGRSETILTSLEYPLSLQVLRFELFAEPSANRVFWELEASETEGTYYLEYSQDGLNWQVLGSYALETERALVEFWHKDYKEENYYRLRQEEANTPGQMSPIRFIERQGRAVQQQPYPNPSSSLVYFASASEQLTQLRIYNSLGQELGLLPLVQKAEGLFACDLSAYPDGLYYLQFGQQSYALRKQAL